MQNLIPYEAFSKIQAELERQPLPINKFRPVSGVGRSQAFGVVNRRSCPPDYSRNCWHRPYLYSLLLEFGKNISKDLSWNAITVNQNYCAGPHRDKGNVGNSFLTAFGDYTGGELNLLEGDLSGSYNIRGIPIIMDFKNVLHSVSPFTGNRYSLVYYWCSPRGQDLPEPSVHLEDGKYYFYRGKEKITRQGLPHPLRRPRLLGSELLPVQEEPLVTLPF